MNNCLLNYTDWFDADLTGARFDYATLNQPVPKAGGFNRTFLFASSLKGCNFSAADLTAVNYFGTSNNTNDTFGTLDTKLEGRVNERRNSVLRDMERSVLHDEVTSDETALRARKALTEEGFLYWFPYSSDDGAAPHFYKKLLVRLGLDRFPYTD